jgi:HlyD family secretion protein
VLEEYQDALIVPEAAIAYDADKQAYVDVHAPDTPAKTRRVMVTTGASSGMRTQSVEGLSEGDRVVLPR